MTQLLLDELAGLPVEVDLIDRRFSREVSQVGRFSIRKVLAGVWLIARLAARVMVRRPSIVVLFATNRQPSLIVDWCLTAVLGLAKVPFISYLHTMGWRTMRGTTGGRIAASVLKRSRVVVTLGSSMTLDVEALCPGLHVAEVANAVRHPASSRRKVVGDTVAFLGNYLPTKGVDTFVEVAFALCPEFPTLHWESHGAVVDESFMDSVGRRVNQGPTSHISVLPPVYGSGRDAFLDESRLLIFPSLYPFEAQPLVVIEALSHGTPVVAYDVGGLRDLLEGAPWPSLVAPGDLESLIRAVRACLQLDGDVVAEAAMRIYRERHSVRRYRERWAEILGGGQ